MTKTFGFLIIKPFPSLGIVFVLKMTRMLHTVKNSTIATTHEVGLMHKMEGFYRIEMVLFFSPPAVAHTHY